ncbi:MAG TPA: DUF4332 domain-containing protein, partial [Anaerolineales bacterium]|nr:DUF4332 domain-containing protein [Anaerolineales bacterium]
MKTTDTWPSEIITPQTFADALCVIGVEKAIICKYLPLGGAGIEFTAHPKVPGEFIRAAATPEQRQKLASAIGCRYDKLTQWVICADLCRLGSVNAKTAKLLMLAGVKGVCDLAACLENTQRRRKLETDLMERGEILDLDKLADEAGKKDAWTVTDVSVILVVKGAGLQQPDDTLDVFLNGFWPAIKSVDSRAVLTKRQDIFPSGYRSSVYDNQPINQVTEIRSGERRIWLKEPYWDAALVPANPLSALAKEWRMATYAFGSGIHELFFNPDSRRREISRWQYFLAFLAIYALIFAHIGLTVMWEYRPWLWSLFGAENSGLLLLTETIITVAAIIAGLAALIVVVLSALQTEYQMKKKPLENLPGVGGWVVGLLIVTLLFSPNGYILWLLVWVVLELALLVARA